MKKKYILPALLLAMTGLTSCFDDESTYADHKLTDIEIEENVQEKYTVESYVGKHLDIPLTIKGGFKPEELTYRWMLIDNLKDFKGDEYEAELISTDKDLHYEVNLKPGTYTVTCEITSVEHGYFHSLKATLIVETSFSMGFYILKESAGGDTELDFYNPKTSALGADILASTGNELKGKPRSLSLTYNQCYVNEDGEADEASMVHVTSESGEYKAFRTLDFRATLNRDNMLYEPMADNEYVLGLYRGTLMNFLVTNLGIRGTYSYDTMASKGYYGTVSGTGGSTFTTGDGNTHYMWDETNHHLYTFDANGGIAELDPVQTGLTDYECLSAGINDPNGTAVYLFRDQATGGKVLYQLSDTDVREKHAVDPASHLAQGDLYTTNAKQAAIIYVVDGGKLYAHSLLDHTELEYQLQGLPAGTPITYLSNQYYYVSDTESNKPYKEDEFDYLIVGSQQGNRYTLYMYETLGGQPKGTPVRVVEGEGTFKCIRFLGRKGIAGYFPYTD